MKYITICNVCGSKQIRMDPETRLPYCKNCGSFSLKSVYVKEIQGRKPKFLNREYRKRRR